MDAIKPDQLKQSPLYEEAEKHSARVADRDLPFKNKTSES